MNILKEISHLKNSEIIQRQANKIARQRGYGKATGIILGNENKVINHVAYGYRKYTTGEYVSNSYRNNFGWKNTYYQRAETIVEVSLSFSTAAQPQHNLKGQ